ncbi:uncharacterized protein LOC111123666 [Crassostrea virginica]
MMDPPEREVKDFRFQQLCRIRIFNPPDVPFQGATNLVACSSKYCLTFLGTTSGFKVIETSVLTDIDNRHASERTTLIVSDPPFRVSVQVEGAVSHLSLSCDELTLAVVVTLDGIVQIYVYDVRGFTNQGQTVEPFQKIRVSTEILDLSWNPTQPNLLVICMSDGRAQLFEVTENLNIVASLPAVVSARSVCWSPKGKQLVIGTGNGTLMQFDHELKKKRDWDRPSVLPQEQQFEVRGVSWISTYMFLASYFPSGSPDEQPIVVLTSGSKDGAPAFVNFLDPCYGNGEGANVMHFNYIPQWEMVLCTSSTACETAIIAKHFDNKNTFERWTLDDAARAELPLTEDYVDTFPLGAAVDLSSQFAIPVGERSHPPSPMFMLLSTDGVLVAYYMMYSHAEAPVITVPPQKLPSGPVRKSLTANVQGSIQSDAMPIGGKSKTQSEQPSATTIPKSQTSDVNTTGFGLSSTGFTGKSLFGAPASQGISIASSAPSAGSVFGQSASATSQVGQSFLASALSKPASDPSSAKTGFAAMSGAPSLFNLKPQQPQQSTNFSFNAAVTTPATTAVSTQAGVTPSTSGFSFSGQSFSGSNSGFSFSLPSSNTTGQTTLASVVPAGSTAITSSTSQSQMTFGTSTASKQTSFSFTTSSSLAAGFGVQPSVPSTASTFGTAPATTSTKSVFESSSSSPLPKFGSTTEPRQPAAPSPAVPPVSAGSSSGVPGFGSSSSLSVPAFGVKPGTGTMTSSLGDVKPATNTNSISQSKAPIASALTSNFGGSIQNLSTLGNAQNLSVTKPQQTPAAEIQLPDGGRQISALRNPAADTNQKTTAGSSVSDSLNDTFSASIAEEISDFEKEMREFKQRAGAVKNTIGSKEEMQKLRNNTMKISKFCEEVKANTKEQSKEISDLKNLCLDGFAMVEDCKMREQCNTDVQYIQLMKNRALDPKSVATMRSLQQQQQLLDQGLRDVDAILDQEWQDYQNKKKKRHGIQRPTTDGIYQVIKSNRNLIIREKYQLDELETQLKQIKLYNRNSSWKHPDTSREPAELSSLADTLLESPQKSPEKPRRGACVQSLNPQKQAKLREYLSRKTVTKVKSTRPENLSLSRLAATEKIRLALSRQTSPTKAPPSADIRPEMKPSIQGRTILRATSHNGTRQLVTPSGQPASPGLEMGLRQQNNIQPKPNSYQQGFMFANSGNTKPSMMGLQQKAGQNLKPTASYPQFEFEDITPASTATEDEDDDYDDEDDDYDDDDDDGLDPDSEHDSEPLNRKIAERKPAANVPAFSLTPTTKSLSFSPQTFGQGKSGFTSLTGGSKSVFGTKPDSTTPSGSPQPAAFSAGFQGFKANEKTPTNTSTPKTAFKFGSEITSFGGKSLFGQPPNTEGNKTEESKPVISPLLAKALSTESDEDELVSKKTETVKEKTKPEVESSDKQSTEAGSKTPLFGFGKTPSSTSLTESGLSKDEVGQSTKVTSSLFGQSTGTGASVFGGPTSSSASATAGKSLFGFAASTGAPSGSSLFGQSSPATGGLFGKPIKSEEIDKSSQISSTPAGLFGQTSSSGGGIFGQASSKASAPSTNVDTASNASNTPTVTTASVSASEASPVTQQSTLSTTTTTTGEISSTSNTGSGHGEARTYAPGIYGQNSSPVSSAGSGLFGQSTFTKAGIFTQTTCAPPTYSSTEAGLIGRPLTSGSGAFGQSSTTSSAGTGMFGQQTTTTGSALFGQPTTSSTAGVFGQTTTSSGTGLFGQQTSSGSGISGPASTASTTTASGILGQTDKTLVSGGGLFGTTSTTSSSATGLFGQSATEGFGQSSTGAKSAVLGGLLSGANDSPATSTAFGQGPAKNLFGTGTSSAAPSFGQPASGFGSSPASSGFGTAPTSAGFGSSAGGFGFGSTAVTNSASGFGQSTQTGLFGQPTSSSSSAFGGFGSGQSSGGLFGGGGGGGGMFSGLGGKPSEDKAKTNVFGSVPAFGSTTTSSSTGSLFGTQNTSTFGSAGGSSPFSGSAFSGGGSNVASTGFAISKSQSPGGFGAAPSFGGSPAFGGQAFGSSPSFGSAPTFGSGSAFGGGSTFQSPQQSSGGGSGFAGFASSASPTFGSLAHDGNAPTFGNPQQGGGGFGGFGGTGGGGGGFGGGSTGFGQSPSTGGNPSFTGYRG